MKTAIIVSVLLFRLATVANAQSQLAFTAAPGSPLAAGAAPLCLAVGDFNGDGIQDFVTANAGSNNVTVLLGNGSGGFTAAPGSPFTVGTYPGFVVVGDFNKDGHQDLAIANEGPNGGLTLNGGSLTILLGNGSGGFTTAPGSPISFGASPSFLAVGDFNEDGIQDLATLNPANDSLAVLLGNGAGGFTLAKGSPFTLLGAVTSMVVGDFNKDGHRDLVLPGAGVTVLLGNGNGGFTTAPGSPYAAATAVGLLVAGDFNGDGIPDLATATTANNTASTVTILLGNASGGFAAASPVAAGSTVSSLAVGDFNGDGIQDLAATNELTGAVTILLGNGSGGLTPAGGSPFVVGSYPSWVVAGDFNHDGVQDLATTNAAGGNVTVLLGKGAGATTTPVISQGGIVPVYSTVTTIQSGEWVSIYGSNLAGSAATWKGDFPTSLGGTTVTIDGRAAYLWFVGPTQINLQVPDDTTTGSVPVVVTTASGSVTSTVTLASFAPSFSLLDSKHVTGIIIRSNGSGTLGGGTYDIIGPTGTSLGYPTVAAKAGDSVVLFAVGLGPTNPTVPAGQVYSSAAATTNSVNLLVNKVNVIPTFAGLSSAGLYQINLTVPANLGTGDVPLVATVGGVQTPTGVVISLQ